MLLESVLLGEPLEQSGSSLSPAQAEAVCEEYLRNKYPTFYKLYPSGGGLKNVDIIGKSGSGDILAQVTKDSGGKLKEKFETVAGLVDEDNTVFLFGNDNSGDAFAERDEDVVYLGLDEVIDELDGDARTENLIDEMLSRPHIE